MGKLFKDFQILCTDFHLVLVKRGNYSRGDVIQGRILIKEIRYMIYPVWNRSVHNYPEAKSLILTPCYVCCTNERTLATLAYLS